ncbi:hypothetical protein [Paenibacillus tundrae]
MNPNELFEEKQGLVFHAIVKKYGSYEKADMIARRNNMEFYDMMQIGRMVLWRICTNYDPAREESLNGYIIKSVQYRIMQEFHRNGLPIRFSDWCPSEKRASFNFHSIDAATGEGESGHFAVTFVDPAAQVVTKMEVEELMNKLSNEEQFVLRQRAAGYLEEEIAMMMGTYRRKVTRIKNRACKKLNPDFKPTGAKNGRNIKALAQ